MRDKASVNLLKMVLLNHISAGQGVLFSGIHNIHVLHTVFQSLMTTKNSVLNALMLILLIRQ